MAVMAIPKFQRLFRVAADLGVDKEDLRRYNDFINHKIYDLLVRAQATASENERDIIEPQDIPITKGFAQCLHDFRELNEQVDVAPILDELTNRPALDYDYTAETEARLPELAGGLTVALARAFKLLDPGLKNPHGEQWERAFKIFDLLL
jgi:hypothetical protein